MFDRILNAPLPYFTKIYIYNADHNLLHYNILLQVRFIKNKLEFDIYNHFHNILRLFDVLTNFFFTTSETMRDYYL